MTGQMTIFDWMPEAQPEPEVGEYVTEHGTNIPHIMRPGYIGKKVVIDCSTASRKWYQVGILEEYIPYEGTFRSIVYTGKKQRSLITHREGYGTELYECLPWDAYPERMKAIGGKWRCGL